MYSFVLKAHQKIDRAAYKNLLLIDSTLPLSLKEILHFEGSRGPDSSKFKKGTNKPPWHFYNPGGENAVYLGTVSEHYARLVKELREHNKERAAFEAAWLAHALVDGLTPAHHFPYEEEQKALRSEQAYSRESYSSIFVVKGTTPRDTLKRSLQLIGPKGLLTTHTTFEAGAAMVIMPLAFAKPLTNLGDLVKLDNINGVIELFKLYATEVQHLNMYERFMERGWTAALIHDAQVELGPRMVDIVMVAWQAAFKEAASAPRKT
jgi:hypothetical protein